MLRARVGAGLLAGCLVAWNGAARAQQPSAETILKYRPRQDGVLLSTPAAHDVAGCRVEAVKGSGKGAGWLLRDPQGRPLRRFFDTNYDGRARTGIDVYSYYHEGVETYRETIVNTRDEPDQIHHRWLNAGGLKWGVDVNKDGRIDSWKAISPEEVSQEVLQAVLKKDFARLQALMISDADIKALDLPADAAARLRTLRRGAEAKFQATCARLTSLTDKTQWLHLELGAPHCQPADAPGRADVVKYANGTVLCETGGKNEWLQTGELVQVGANAWRLVDAPAPGHDGGAGPAVAESPELQKLLKDLGELDGEWAKKQGTPAAPADVVRYNLARADLIEKVVGAVKQEDRDQWIRQVADCLSAAAQGGGTKDNAAQARLTALMAQLEKAMPAGHALVAYVTFREMQADYGAKIADTKGDPAKVQQEWLERLTKFVKAFPTADDAADALLSLGWGHEMIGKEIEAKNWYAQLARDFAAAPQAAKAKGALRRLDLEGKVLELSGPTLAGAAYDVAGARGKVVVVYFWASWNAPSAGDFDKMKQLLDKHGKDLELVTVNLDTSADEAAAFVKRTSAPGVHLHQPGGLESKLATDYGVMMLPNLFVLDREGKVVNRAAQVGALTDELKKLIK